MKGWALASLTLLGSLLCAYSQHCGSQAGGALCGGGFCCSKWGFCGHTEAFCDVGQGCQSECWSPAPPTPAPPSPGGGVGDLITSSMFDEMLLQRNNPACPARGFYTYDAFVAAADTFPGFATSGDAATRKREVAAFLGQTSHETTGGWATAPGGPYAWGYCFLEENTPTPYCVPDPRWPCAPGKKYCGRGPMQLSYNFNYGPAGEALGLDLLNDPDAVARDPIVAFRTALWFWMTPQPPKPSCHDVITGAWVPSPADQAARRVPGYGVITNIINGGLECGRGPDLRVADRIGYYKRYCDLLGVGYGDNLDCNTQSHFGFGSASGSNAAALVSDE